MNRVLLADHLGIKDLGIAVVSGHVSPAKTVAVDRMNDETAGQNYFAPNL